MIVKKDDDDAKDSKQASVCNNETAEPAATTVQPTNIISQDGIVKKEEDNESVYGYETD